MKKTHKLLDIQLPVSLGLAFSKGGRYYFMVFTTLHFKPFAHEITQTSENTSVSRFGIIPHAARNLKFSWAKSIEIPLGIFQFPPPPYVFPRPFKLTWGGLPIWNIPRNFLRTPPPSLKFQIQRGRDMCNPFNADPSPVFFEGKNQAILGQEVPFLFPMNAVDMLSLLVAGLLFPYTNHLIYLFLLWRDFCPMDLEASNFLPTPTPFWVRHQRNCGLGLILHVVKCTTF